ncbi:MAG: hypothetical protein ACC645_17195 [Pirellulales bacterium]
MARKRSIRNALALLTVTVGVLLGCSMCQDCYDDAPPVIGSSEEVGSASGGRAGSAVGRATEATIVSDAEEDAERSVTR